MFKTVEQVTAVLNHELKVFISSPSLQPDGNIAVLIERTDDHSRYIIDAMNALLAVDESPTDVAELVLGYIILNPIAHRQAMIDDLLDLHTSVFKLFTANSEGVYSKEDSEEITKIHSSIWPKLLAIGFTREEGINAGLSTAEFDCYKDIK